MLKAPSDFEDLKNKIGSEYANSIRPIIKTNKMSPSGFEFYMLEFLKLFEDISADYSARIKDIVSIFKYISGTFQDIIEKIYIENEDSNKIEILEEDTAIGRFTYLATLKNRDFLSAASKVIISMYSKKEANQEDLREIEDGFRDIEDSIGTMIEDEGLSFEKFYNDDAKVDMFAYLAEALGSISKLEYEK